MEKTSTFSLRILPLQCIEVIAMVNLQQYPHVPCADFAAELLCVFVRNNLQHLDLKIQLACLCFKDIFC